MADAWNIGFFLKTSQFTFCRRWKPVGSYFVSCEGTFLRNVLYVWYSLPTPSPCASFGHIWHWAPTPGSQNSGLGYERNPVSELFVFTGNLKNPSRKHLLKCKRPGKLIRTLNLARRKRCFFCSPKGLLTGPCRESDKGHKGRKVSLSRVVCVCARVCTHSFTRALGGREENCGNVRGRKTN